MRGECTARLQGVLSIDVEDYFQVEAFSDLVRSSDWDNYPSRVAANTGKVLDLLDECGTKATFFILGWVADRFPSLVREIVARGHEPACHSYWHRLIYRLTPAEFRQDTLQAKQAVEQAAGVAVSGYRAPSYSITRNSVWALEILAECGFQYDSSIFPIHHDFYGIPTAPRFPFRLDIAPAPLLECPLTTFRFPAGPNLPVGGGGYLRLFPFWLTRLGVRRAAAEKLPVITYLHPWELDPEQPRLAGGRLSRLRHYRNLSLTAARLRRLCELIHYVPFGQARLDRTAPLVGWNDLRLPRSSARPPL